MILLTWKFAILDQDKFAVFYSFENNVEKVYRTIYYNGN